MTYNPLTPDPDKPYATCDDCGLTFATREETHAHLHQTLDAAELDPHGNKAGHRAHVINPTREERLLRQIDMEIDSALSDLVYELFDLHERYGATKDEITEALKRVDIDLADAWAQALEEDDR